MATIGTFKKNGEEFSGLIETLTLKATITISANEKKSDAAPDDAYFNTPKGSLPKSVRPGRKQPKTARNIFQSASARCV